MLFYMVPGRIDIAAAKRATEFSHSLLELWQRLPEAKRPRPSVADGQTDSPM
jgi:hypothetical protein